MSSDDFPQTTPPRPITSGSIPVTDGGATMATSGPSGSMSHGPLLIEAGRYRGESLIGRGGMGEVYRAHDPALDRPLALKVMRDQHPDPSSRRRFLEEARITGQLQHPGVPPVHEVGDLPDGRPFMAMKLIEGRTLSDLLKERATPTEDLPRFINVFVSLCQTLAYAHSRGVIHRDLKPANIMVGAFGEVQVMDWGLAKHLVSWGRQPPETQQTQGPDAPHSPEETQDGTIIGTPSYMAPEQARGEINHLDERADVFGLGAILCVILTGEPPYGHGDGTSILIKAASSDLDLAWNALQRCGADRELIDLARRCLASDREARPRHAGEVAKQTEAYLTGVQERLRQAEVEKARAEVKRAEERRRRRLRLALGLAVVALLAILGGAAWWTDRQESRRRAEQLESQVRREEQLRLAVDSSVEQAKRLREKWLFDAAERVLDKAVEQVGEDGPERLRQQIANARKDLHEVRRLDRIQQDLLVMSLDNTRRGDAGAADLYAEGFRAIGHDALTGDVDDFVQYVKRSRVRQELETALDEWLFLTVKVPDVWPRMWEIGAKLHPDEPWRQLSAKATPKEILAAVDQSRVSPEFLSGLCGELDQEGIAPLKDAIRRHPSHLLLRLNAGSLLCDEGKFEEGLAHFTAARAIRPEGAIVQAMMGYAYLRKGDLESALAMLREARTYDPDSGFLCKIEGNILSAKGDHKAAIKALGEASRLMPSLHEVCSVEIAMIHLNLQENDKALEILERGAKGSNFPPLFNALGVARERKRDFADAKAAYLKAIDLNPRFAMAHCNLGTLHLSQNRLDEAIAPLRKAIELDPQLALAYVQLATAVASKDRDESLRLLKKAVELKPNNSTDLNNLGKALVDRREFEEAIPILQKSIEADPRNVHAHINLATALTSIRPNARAIQLLLKATTLDPTSAPAFNSLGIALSNEGDLNGARNAYQKAIDVNPRYAVAYHNLGGIYLNQNRVGEALPLIRKALELDPSIPEAYVNLATALGKEDADEAIRLLKKAVELRPTYSSALNNLGKAYYDKRAFDEAISYLRRAIASDPRNVNAYINLASSLVEKKQYAEAIPYLRKAVDLDPKSPQSFNSLGSALKAQGDFDGALKAYQQALGVDPNYATAHTNLGNLYLARKDYDAAIESFARAVKLAPEDALMNANLAVGYYLKKDYRSALAPFRKSLQIEPRQPDIEFLFAESLLLSSAFREAEEVLRRWKKTAPANHRFQKSADIDLDAAVSMAAAEKRLPDVLAEKDKPRTAQEWLDLAWLCYRYQESYATAARFYGEAMRAEPKLFDGATGEAQQNAARSALLAASGAGKDAEKLTDAVRVELRKQALGWLQKDLAIRRKLAEIKSNVAAVRQTLTRWREETSLASVRDADALKKLPETERAEWLAFWKDVTTLLTQTDRSQ